MMTVALQEVVNDVCDGAFGSVYARVVDPATEVYQGPGCVEGLGYTNASGRTSRQKIHDLVAVLKRWPGLGWVEFNDVEHHLCEFHKYVLIVEGKKDKPYPHERLVGPGRGNGFVNAQGWLKSLAERVKVSRRNRKNSRGHRGKCVRPKSLFSKKQKLLNNAQGGASSGYTNKSPAEAEKHRVMSHI